MWVYVFVRVCLMSKLNNPNSLLNKENKPADMDEGVFFVHVKGLRVSVGEACVAP